MLDFKIVKLIDGEREKEKIAQTVLVTVGRRFYTKDLRLKEAGIALDGGRILVDERMETNVKEYTYFCLM